MGLQMRVAKEKSPPKPQIGTVPSPRAVGLAPWEDSVTSGRREKSLRGAVHASAGHVASSFLSSPALPSHQLRATGSGAQRKKEQLRALSLLPGAPSNS